MESDILRNLAPPVPFPRSYWVIPGLLLAGEYPGNNDPEVTQKKIGAMIDLGIRHIVNLMESDETNHDGGALAPYEPLLVNLGALKKCRISATRFQVVDYRCPSPDRMRAILDDIDDSIQKNRPVYVHCWGGIGRTGTVVGCFLLRHGLASTGSVIKTIARLREKDPNARRISPENQDQVDFVTAWAARETGPPSRLNRFIGCLLGGAVGDALGAPVEFLSFSDIRKRYGNNGIVDYDPAYGRIGAITDDTQMTLFTAEGLLRAMAGNGGKLIPDRVSDLHHAYVQWVNTQGISSKSPFDGSCEGILFHVPALRARRAPGNSCLSALSGGTMGTVIRPVNNSKGCGGVMRAAPAGLIAPNAETAFQIGCETAAITHGHPSGYLAAGGLAAIIHVISNGGGLADGIAAAVEEWEKWKGNDECLSAVRKAVELASRSPRSKEAIAALGGGWVAEEALAISIYCALCAPDVFEDGIIAAVNHSGDSDSTGAITGNILGCLLGSTSIADKWKDHLEMKDVIEKIAVDLFIRYRDAEWWRKQYGKNPFS